MVTAMMHSNATWPFDREGQKSYAHVNLPWERFRMRPQQETSLPLNFWSLRKDRRNRKDSSFYSYFLYALLVQHSNLCCATDREKDGLILFLLELLISILSSGKAYAYF